MDSVIHWPPVFTIKKHPRARRVKLKASLHHGLELIVPPRFNQKDIPYLLEQNRSWIEKQLLIIQRRDANKDILPTQILFSAINQNWLVNTISSDKKLRIMQRPHQQEIVLVGNLQNNLAGKKLLYKWVKEQARIHLLEKLAEISREIQHPYQTATIRDQTSRWGSCSPTQSINLNFKLIFLPPELVRHVMIHELCHTVHMNHSEKFWQRVEKFDPNWLSHRKLLRKTENYIPEWLGF